LNVTDGWNERLFPFNGPPTGVTILSSETANFGADVSHERPMRGFDQTGFSHQQPAE
jgi:hypothetical protein